MKTAQWLLGLSVLVSVTMAHAKVANLECTNVKGTVKISKSELTVTNRTLALHGVNYTSRGLFNHSTPNARYSLEIAGVKQPISTSRLRTDECGNKGFRRISAFDIVVKNEAKQVILEESLICDESSFAGVCD